jgi:hypothetical protein
MVATGQMELQVCFLLRHLFYLFLLIKSSKSFLYCMYVIGDLLDSAINATFNTHGVSPLNESYAGMYKNSKLGEFVPFVTSSGMETKPILLRLMSHLTSLDIKHIEILYEAISAEAKALPRVHVNASDLQSSQESTNTSTPRPPPRKRQKTNGASTTATVARVQRSGRLQVSK